MPSPFYKGWTEAPIFQVKLSASFEFEKLHALMVSEAHGIMYELCVEPHSFKS